ncbi:MAG: hypothetical protein ACJBCI_04260 [Candidatus Tisiphia sp.]|uniref:hypothetical protein n=1 Tax=Candidatus Tisiphia endosymbiont of Melanophora roralis TaxID=3066261 RepID=UPI001E7321FE|nr:MAG: hypothetical protein LF884_01775 [Rickettsia endosymbiont of Cimex lectularius]
MSKQQNYLFKKQDVVKAQEILTAVQEKNIKAIYTIIGLPRAIQEKLTDKTSIDAEKILTKQLSDLKNSHDKDEKKFASINKNKLKELDALCKKLATEKQELEQVQKCLNLTHAINDTSVPIKQILTMSDISYRIIEKLNLDRKYTTIPEVVQQLENLLPTFSSSGSDSDYGSDLSRSTSETQHTVKLLSNISNNSQQHELLSKLKKISNEFALKRGLDNTAPTNNHIDDDVSVAGEYPDMH